MCGNAALQPVRKRSGPALADVEEQPQGGQVAAAGGLDLTASAVNDGRDGERQERVCRYLFRGPRILRRLRQRDDGLLSWRLKKPDRRGNTVPVTTPKQLLARLCSLMPAPGSPARMYFGVLAGSAKLRKHIVPSPTTRKKAHCGDGVKPRHGMRWTGHLFCAGCGYRTHWIAHAATASWPPYCLAWTFGAGATA